MATTIGRVDPLLTRAVPVQVAALLTAATGAVLEFLLGGDTAILPTIPAVLTLGALVVALVRHRWVPLVGLAAAAYPAVERDHAGRLLHAVGAAEVAAAVLVPLGLVVGAVAGIVAVVRGDHRHRSARAGRGAARRAVAGGVALLVVLASATAGYAARNVGYAGLDAVRVEQAGYVERRVDVGGVALNYAEGPDNGPPLLLIHGQLTDWRNWSRVLPALSQRFHVFAVDCHGHGSSDRAPDRYTADAMVADLAEFIDRVIGGPAIVAGHSSGGLVAAGLAADAPERVRAVVLEDPPLFSSVLPRARQTFNHVDLASAAHGFLRSGATDFTTHYARHSALWELLGDGVRDQALRYRAAHPDEPLRLWFMPPMFNEPFRAMPDYDPRFGQAFFDGSFHRGFDHADVLRRIAVPAVLIHTSWSYDEDGILLAAMDGDDAQRARSLIPDVEFHRVGTGHGFHAEDPDHFIRIVNDLADLDDLADRVAG